MLGPLTPQELASFQSIQETLSHFSTLIDHNSNKTLWIDLDAFKEFGFEAVIFYTSTNKKLFQGRWPSNSSVKPILFLFRLLTIAEKNYWPTKLEIVSFVWVIKKVRYLVKSSWTYVIIQTDYSIILDILQQSSITLTISTMRINL